MLLKENHAHILRHRLKHHLHHCFSRGIVVLQHPFLCHANRPHTIESNAIGKLRIENIGAQLFFYKICIGVLRIWRKF